VRYGGVTFPEKGPAGVRLFSLDRTMRLRYPFSQGQIFGHRCAAALAPENSLAALQRAQRLGCAGVEIDVRLSKDKIPVVFHDERLERITNIKGFVAAYTAQDLAQLDIGTRFHPDFTGETVPSLETFLAVWAETGLSLNLEIKASPYREFETNLQIYKVLARWRQGQKQRWGQQGYTDILLSSFSKIVLAFWRQNPLKMPYALIGSPQDRRPLQHLIAQAQSLGCCGLHLPARFMTAKTVRTCHKAGLGVGVWTVNHPLLMRRLRSWGVDVVISDDPQDRSKALYTNLQSR